MADKHEYIDVPYTLIRKAKEHARKTGTKVVRFDLDDSGAFTGKITLRNGRGENRGSFTVTGETVKVHKAPVRKPAKAAATDEATDSE